MIRRFSLLALFLLALFSVLGWSGGFSQSLDHGVFSNAAYPGKGKDLDQELNGMRVRAYPASAVTPLEGWQTIYLIVQDQSLLPVVSAQITVAVQMPNGDKALYICKTMSDENGITQFSFPFSSEQVGIVKIAVKAFRDGLEARTKTSFWIWW